MASVCVDNDDFDVVDGRLKLKPTFVQSVAANFVHVLDGAADVYEQIGELPTVIIPVDGTYLVSFEAHGNATNTAAIPGTVVGTSVAAALYKNGALLGNTETRLITNIQGSSTVDQPALQLHATGAATRVATFAAGDTLQVWGSRNADAGTTCQIVSNSTGRTRITAVRLGGI